MIELLLELTDSCNLRCNYCNKWQGNQFLTGETLENRLTKIQELFKKEIRYICFWGGEPFLNPFIDDILFTIENSFLKDEKIDIGFNTNGILLEKKLDRFIEFCHAMDKNQITLYISLDGITEGENKNRGLTDAQIQNILATLIVLKQKNIPNLKIVISSVLVADVVSLEQFANSVKYFEQQQFGLNFCFQEYMEDTTLKVNQAILRSILERYFFLKKQNVHVVYEDSQRFGKLFRINATGDIFNLIDGCFGDIDFLLGNIAQLSKIPLTESPDNAAIWNTVYKVDSYVALITKIHNSVMDSYK